MPGPMRRQMMNGKKEKFDMKSLKKVFVFAKPFLPMIIISVIFAIFGTITTIIGPDKVSELINIITDGIFTGVDMTAFVRLAIFLLCIYAFGAVFNYLQQYLTAIVTQKTSKNLRRDIDKKINKLPLRYFDNTTTGDILSRVTNDVDIISQTLGSSIANLLSSMVLFVGVIVMMFKTNWVLTLVTIGTSVLGFLAMSLILRVSQKYFVKRQQYLGDMNGHVEEIYTNHYVVKSYGAINNERDKFAGHNNNIFNVTWKAQFLSGMMQPIMMFVGNLSYVLIFVVGVSIILQGGTGVTIGTLIAFIIYARLFSQPLQNFAQSMSSVQQASAASRRVFEILEQPELLDESGKKQVLADAKGNVEFKHVQFGYLPNKTIIHDFSAKLKAGQKVAIVGPTGAGKTTMVNLLMRFYEIEAPRLILDGKITDHKIFDGGKSIRLLRGEDDLLFVNNQPTSFKVKSKDFPKNEVLKFNQDFDILVDEKVLDFKLPVVTGHGLDDVKDVALGIAYYGDILIDNVPINALTRENVHDLFDMILQDTWLFGGTVRENLVYNKEGVSDEKLTEVCNAVGLSHFIKTLPNGYDTILTDVSSLSEGQKQQLTIARAMIKDSPLLILDEATSNVDTRTELVIQDAMDALTKGRTSFVIAHRLSTIKNADVILVMQNGDIIEHGNHESLMAQNGFYAELYNSQFVV